MILKHVTAVRIPKMLRPYCYDRDLLKDLRRVAFVSMVLLRRVTIEKIIGKRQFQQSFVIFPYPRQHRFVEAAV
jgi:hypothetical protein